jgi:hypothetical protein
LQVRRVQICSLWTWLKAYRLSNFTLIQDTVQVASIPDLCTVHRGNYIPEDKPTVCIPFGWLQTLHMTWQIFYLATQVLYCRNMSTEMHYHYMEGTWKGVCSIG